jgi:hypothetical protein
MDDGKGITEAFWSTKVSDDAKMKWRVASRGITFAMALLLPRTPFRWLDILVAMLTMVIPLLVIEAHRAYSKLSPRFLSQVIRCCALGSSFATACLGGVFYFFGFLPFISGVATDLLLMSLGSWGSEAGTEATIHKTLLAGATLLSALYLVIIVFHESRYLHLCYHFPQKTVEKIMAKRPWRTHHWWQFVSFEGGVLVASFVFIALVAEAATVAIYGSRLMFGIFQAIQ